LVYSLNYKKRGIFINTSFFESLLTLIGGLVGFWTDIPVLDYLSVVAAAAGVLYQVFVWKIKWFFNLTCVIQLIRSEKHRPRFEKIRDYLNEKLSE